MLLRKHDRAISMCRVIISLLFICLPYGMVHALTGVERNFQELVSLADVVLVGTVIDKQSYWADPIERREINTQIRLEQLSVIKGEVSTESYNVTFLGGSLPPYIQHIPGAPAFQLQQRYMLFIKDNHKVMFPFVGIHDGIFVIQQLADGSQVVTTTSGQLVIGVNGDQINAVDPTVAKSLAVEGMSERAFSDLVRMKLLGSQP